MYIVFLVVFVLVGGLGLVASTLFVCLWRLVVLVITIITAYPITSDDWVPRFMREVACHWASSSGGGG